MAQRDDILSTLGSLVADQKKLEIFAAGLDKQAASAQAMNLTSKQAGETTDVPDIVKQLAEVMFPVLDELKAVSQRLTALENGTVQAAANSPAITMAEMVKNYMYSGETTDKGAVNTRPDISNFQTPTLNKGQQQQAASAGGHPFAIFNELTAGVYDKKPAGK